MKISLTGFVFATLMVTGCAVNPAGAAETDCPQNYAFGEAPEIASAKMKNGLAELCFEGFGVFHSSLTATPFWAAQHLNKERVLRAKQVDRVDSFHAEQSLPAGARAELSHYSRSGYDRGHLAPAADMDSYQSQEASFSLANIVPQHSGLNRHLWASVEVNARKLAIDYGEVYVVTGAAFNGNELRILRDRVYVPSAMYKAVYIPRASAASVWWAPNEEPGTQFEVISVAELERRIGVDIFPGLDEAVKAQPVKLPEPSKSQPRVDKGWDWYAIITDLLMALLRMVFR